MRLVVPQVEVGTVLGLVARGESNCVSIETVVAKAAAERKGRRKTADSKRPALFRLHELRRRSKALESWMRLGPSRPGFDDHTGTWVEEYEDIASCLRGILGRERLEFKVSKQALQVLAGCLSRLGKFSECEEALDSLAVLVSREEGKDAGARLLIEKGESARSAGLRGLAVSRFDRAKGRASSDEVKEHAAYLAALVCRAAGLRKEWRGRAFQLAEAGTSAWTCKAIIALAEDLLKSREYEEAGATYELLLERFGTSHGANALLGLGTALEAKGDVPGALRVWRRLILDHPDSPLAKTARARIESASARVIDWLEER